MSSKFSIGPPPSKPPAICHKPPIGPDWPWPPFPDTPFDGYVIYVDHDSPTEGGMEASISMTPWMFTNVWRGQAQDGLLQLVLRMTIPVPHIAVNFQLEYFYDGLLDNTIAVFAHIPRSMQPFDSGEIVPDDQPPNGRTAWHVWF